MLGYTGVTFKNVRGPLGYDRLILDHIFIYIKFNLDSISFKRFVKFCYKAVIHVVFGPVKSGPPCR